MNRYGVLPNKFDLEGGFHESTRTRSQRIVFVRTRRLVIAYLVLLTVLLLVVVVPYLEQHAIYGFELSRLSLTSSEPAATHGLPLPRHRDYIVFESPSDVHPWLADRPLRSATKLPDHCLESHFALGYPCFNQKNTSFDIVWTWVNGSDQRFQEAMADATLDMYPEIGEKGKKILSSRPTSKLYRDHDELRHSFRSVLQHFRPYTKQFTLLTSDFPFSVDDRTEFDTLPNENRDAEVNVDSHGDNHSIQNKYSYETRLDLAELTRNRTLRMGQLPSWLRPEEQRRWIDGNVKIEVIYQAQMFRDYKGTSFNSYGIESQFPYLRHIEENFIYLNDDFFFTSDLSPSDFSTSAYGIVVRLDPTMIVEPTPSNANVSPVGEWGPLGYSSWILSERFGKRGRPYPVHAAKSFSVSLLNEAAHVWEAEFSATAGHKFRGMKPSEGGGSGDAYMSFLFAHFVIERWREALLWSWVIGRIGGDRDQWSEGERRKAWQQLGGDIDDLSQKIIVELKERKTVEKDRVAEALRLSGQQPSGRTAYAFSSGDGYPYGYRTKDGKTTWPRFSGENIGQHLCTIDFDDCIGSSSSASEAFKTIAFEKPSQCGDCIIHALRSSSGILGLSAFLPRRGRTFKPNLSPELFNHYLQSDVRGLNSRANKQDDEDDTADKFDAVAHLPLVKNWAQGDFTLDGVLGPYGTVDLREWAMRLLERYRFVLGDTNTVFLMVDGPGTAVSGVKRVTPDVSLLCMNDDVTQYHMMTDKILRDWQERQFGRPAEWER